MLDSLLGGAAGSGAGAYLGSRGRGPGISDLLAPLDFPRQALANLGRGVYRGVTGEGTWEDLLGALPGAAGILAGALTGGPGAILAGGLTGGLAQGAGKMSGSDAFQAPETSHLLEAMGGDPEDFLQNMMLGAATDPLTYAGFGPGARAGKAARGGRGGLSGYHSGVPASLFGEDALSGTAGRAELAGMVDLKTGRPLGYLPTAPRAPAASKEMEVLEVLPHGQAATVPAGATRPPGSVLPRELDRARPNQDVLAAMHAEHDAQQGALARELMGRSTEPLADRFEMMSQKYPAQLTPQEFEGKLNGLYGVARDFEDDLAHGAVRLSPQDVLRQRASLWEEILGGESHFADRGSRSSYGWADGVPEHLANTAWATAERTLPPDVIPQLIERHAQVKAENLLRQYITDPSFERMLRHSSGNLMERGQVVYSPLENLADQALSENALRGNRAAAGAAYARHDKPIVRLLQGKVSPEEAQTIIDRLVQQGYPINRQDMLAAWERSRKLQGGV